MMVEGIILSRDQFPSLCNQQQVNKIIGKSVTIELPECNNIFGTVLTARLHEQGVLARIEIPDDAVESLLNAQSTYQYSIGTKTIDIEETHE